MGKKFFFIIIAIFIFLVYLFNNTESFSITNELINNSKADADLALKIKNFGTKYNCASDKWFGVPQTSSDKNTSKLNFTFSNDKIGSLSNVNNVLIPVKPMNKNGKISYTGNKSFPTPLCLNMYKEFKAYDKLY